MLEAQRVLYLTCLGLDWRLQRITRETIHRHSMSSQHMRDCIDLVLEIVCPM